MYVAGINFLVMVSHGVNLITSEFIPTRKKDNLKDSLVHEIILYQNKGMHVTTALVDGEFDALSGKLGSTDLNATAASEHVAEIERKLHLIKERFHALRSTLPFKIIPGRIIIEGVSFVATWLNAFPSKTGASMTYSPCTIMMGTTLDFAKHCKTPFGSYCQVFQENTPLNTMKERTVAAICLGLTGNLQGSCKYFALTTKKKIARPQVIPLPMTDTIIAAWVEKITASQQMPENIIFTTNRGEIVEVGDKYDDMGPLHVDYCEYFPTAISQECSDNKETMPELADIPQAVWMNIWALPIWSHLMIM